MLPQAAQLEFKKGFIFSTTFDDEDMARGDASGTSPLQVTLHFELKRYALNRLG